MSPKITVLLMTIPERGGPEAADSLKMIEYFGFCTLVEENVITMVFYDLKE